MCCGGSSSSRRADGSTKVSKTGVGLYYQGGLVFRFLFDRRTARCLSHFSRLFLSGCAGTKMALMSYGLSRNPKCNIDRLPSKRLHPSHLDPCAFSFLFSPSFRSLSIFCHCLLPPLSHLDSSFLPLFSTWAARLCLCQCLFACVC